MTVMNESIARRRGIGRAQEQCSICTHICPSTRIHLLSYDIFNERLSVIVKILVAFVGAFSKHPIMTVVPLSNPTQC